MQLEMDGSLPASLLARAVSADATAAPLQPLLLLQSQFCS
jgi:hypothetical protein